MFGAPPDVEEPALARHRARVERHMADLAELAALGMGLARDQARRAEAAVADDGPDPGLAFSRLARAVRQTIALEARLSERLISLDREDQAGAMARLSEAMEGAAERVRARLKRIVEQADAEEAEEAAQAEAPERLGDAPDGEDWVWAGRELGLADEAGEDGGGLPPPPLRGPPRPGGEEWGGARSQSVTDGWVGPLHPAARGPPPPEGADGDGGGPDP